MGELDGKVVIVTGAGGGLGREHALALAREGAAVVVNDLGGSRDGSGAGQELADKVADEIKQAGGEAAANYDNVATLAGGKSILKTALDAFDRVDGLVNNAGILRDKSFANMTEEMWDVVVAVHLRGTFCVTHAVYNHMKQAGEGGVIVSTSSTSGLNGNFGQTNYAAAKAGIAGFMRSLALEGQKYNIRSHILAPVAFTRLTSDLGVFQGEGTDARLDPKLVSPLIAYLMSDLAKELNGKTFLAGGGLFGEIKVITHPGITKKEDGGLWTVKEIAEHMKPGELLMPDSIDSRLATELMFGEVSDLRQK